MDKKEKKDMPQTDTQPRPNRDAYKKAFSEDYPDMDFEDKEARYGRMLNSLPREVAAIGGESIENYYFHNARVKK